MSRRATWTQAFEAWKKLPESQEKGVIESYLMEPDSSGKLDAIKQPSSKSDGSTADYYELPKGATELQHLISHRNLNAQDGEIFRAIYRKGRASHSDELRDAKKVLFYAGAEVDRLEALK